MQIGLFSDTITGTSPEEIAARTRELGVEAVQLRLDWPGLDLAGAAADRARVRRAYQAAGVEIAALAAYTNLLHPDPERRAANRRHVEAAIDAASELGTRMVVTETGTYDATDGWGDHPHNGTPEAWAELLEVTGRLVRRCEREGAILAYEPYVNTVLSRSALAGQLAREVSSPALGFVLDVAGLLTPETLARNGEICAAALTDLGDRLVLVHADDVRYEGETARWLPLGWGETDAEALLGGLLRTGYAGAVIIEHLSESLVPEALAFCRDRLGRLGKEVLGTVG